MRRRLASSRSKTWRTKMADDAEDADSGGQDYSDLYEAAGAKHNVDPALLRTIVHQESGGNANTPDSSKGAVGLAQIMPKTAKKLGVDPKNPAQAIDGAAQLLSESLDRNNGDVGQAVAEYHGGPDRKIWGPKTAAYQKAVLAAYQGAAPQSGPSDDDILAMASGKAPTAPAAAPTASTQSDDDVLKMAGGGSDAEFTADHPKMIGSADIKDPSDLAVYRTLKQGGLLDPEAPAGTEHHPFFNTDPKQVPPGGYFVQNGKVQRAPGGPKESSFGAGLEQGVGDVGATFSHLLPWSDDSQLKNTLLGSQQIYGAKYGGDAASGAGRFIGQLGASAPILGAGEAIAAPALEAAGPLGTFLAGKAGLGAKGASRFLTRGASLAAQGAQTGAGAAALTSSANEGSLPQQMAEGAAGGALLGPVAPALEAAGGAAARGVKSLIEPLTGTGPAKIANRIVGAFSRPAIGDVNPGEIVPGSTPTLATATADPGLAQLERTVRLGPHADQFAARDAQNAQARSDLFDKLKGDEDTVSALKDARDTATSGARDAALNAQTQPADIKPVLDAIDGILKGPEGKRSEVVKALSAVRDNLFDADGNPETDAKMLYGVRKDLGDLLSPKASADKSGAQLAASQLKQVQGALDGAIQDVAPGFKEYLKNYSDLSKPIDEQQLLQSLKISDMRGNITLAKAQAALDKITAMRAKPGANPAKSVSDDTLTQLTALRDDLKRQDNINLARPIGPDTAGHFTTGGRLAQSGLPVAGLAALAHHPVVAAAVGGAKLLYGMKDKQIMAEVANRLLNPEASTVSPAVAQAKQGLLQRMGGAAVPAAGGILANRLLPAQ